jgi:hypothetical protein
MSDVTTTNKGHIEVVKLSSGYAALHIIDVTNPDGSSYSELKDTGFGRYTTQLKALYEAREWAEELNLTVKG